METLIGLVQQHRRALARVVLVVGTLVVARQLWPAVARDTDVELELGPSHADVVEVRISYLLEGEELHGVSFRFDNGAPAKVRHRVSLPSGDFELQCVLRSRDGASRVVTRKLRTPAEGLVRIWVTGETA
jgi:hypothetical protein